MKLLLSVLLLGLAAISHAEAKTLNCSNADGTFQYKFWQPDRGIVPREDVDEKVPSESVWIKQGKVFPADAFKFEEDTIKINAGVPAPHAIERNYVGKVIPEGGKANDAIYLICHEHIDVVP